MIYYYCSTGVYCFNKLLSLNQSRHDKRIIHFTERTYTHHFQNICTISLLSWKHCNPCTIPSTSISRLSLYIRKTILLKIFYSQIISNMAYITMYFHLILLTELCTPVHSAWLINITHRSWWSIETAWLFHLLDNTSNVFFIYIMAVIDVLYMFIFSCQSLTNPTFLWTYSACLVIKITIIRMHLISNINHNMSYNMPWWCIILGLYVVIQATFARCRTKIFTRIYQVLDHPCQYSCTLDIMLGVRSSVSVLMHPRHHVRC